MFTIAFFLYIVVNGMNCLVENFGFGKNGANLM